MQGGEGSPTIFWKRNGEVIEDENELLYMITIRVDMDKDAITCVADGVESVQFVISVLIGE